MPSALAVAAPPENLESAIAQLDEAIVTTAERRRLLERSFELRSGRERPGRFWKIDLDTLDFSGLHIGRADRPAITAPAARGLIACDLSQAATRHNELFVRALGSALDASQQKFAALAKALCNTGAFVYVPADVAVDEPIEIVYRAREALFPYTIVVLEHGAQCTVIERFSGEGNAFVCGIGEAVGAENASLTFAVEQQLPADASAIFTRGAKPGPNSALTWSIAELGATLCVGSIGVSIEFPGVDAQINSLFFPRDDEHVDLTSTVDHAVGASQSNTIIKSAATGRGQARYLGTIRIAPHAQATESALRDDALLLSPRAHIDSVPALEIGANDVKAYHGATVGALDAEQIFYMTSRGIERTAAEKMIALGFFEPAIERFPSIALRERLRRALESKVS